jgi:hypothetical protein
LAQERLAAYQRYAGLVEQQEAALASGDLDGFESLSQATKDLQDRLGAAGALRGIAQDGGVASTFVEQVADLLRTTMARNSRIQARLAGLRQEAGQDIRKTTENRPRVRTYMQGSASEDAPSLDVLL